MKVQDIHTEYVYPVPEELRYWTPDHQGHDPAIASHPKLKKKVGQPEPWFKWARFREVPDSTPVTRFDAAGNAIVEGVEPPTPPTVEDQVGELVEAAKAKGRNGVK